MKNTFLLFFFSCYFSSIIYCQGINRQSSLGYTTIASSITAGPAGEWLAVGYHSVGLSGLVSPLIAHWDEVTDEYYAASMENIISEFPLDETMSVSNVVYDPFGQYYYFAVARGRCDSDLPLLPQILMRRSINNTSGAITLPDGFYGSIYQLAAIDEEGLLIGSNEEENILLFKNNEFYPLLGETYGAVKQLESWSENRFLILGDQDLSIAQLDPTTNTANILQNISTLDAKAVATLNNNKLLVLKANVLVLYNEDLEIEAQHTFAMPTQLTVDGNYVYVLDVDGINFLDHTLNEVGLVPATELDEHVVLGSVARDGRVVYTGAYQVADDYNSYNFDRKPADLFIRSFDITGAEVASDTDLAITEITIDSLRAYFDELYGTNCLNTLLYNVRVALSNEGTETIEKITLNLTMEGCAEWYCPTQTARSWDYEIDLAPGASTTVGIHEAIGYLFLSDVLPNSDFTLCLRAFPNGETMETDLTNNYICADPLLLVQAEEAVANKDFSVYPTICYDQLTLSLPDNSGHFDQAIIYNMLGQTMLKYTLPMGAISFPIDVSYLAAGSYFIRLEGEKRSQMIPFVKN